jgi:hypothetical protein
LTAVVGTIVAVLVVITVVLLTRERTVTPPSILPASAASDRSALIPEGFLRFEGRAATPPADDQVRWVRTDGVTEPPLLAPCGAAPRSDHPAVDVRQLALLHPNLWKAERLIVHVDADAARRDLEERRVALRSCADHDEEGGVRTRWTFQPLPIGDEAIFVTGQRYRDGAAVPGNLRGVVVRQGRSIVMYVDFGQRTAPATPADVPSHLDDSRAIAADLAAASWN